MGGCKGTVHAQCCHWLATSAAFTYGANKQEVGATPLVTLRKEAQSEHNENYFIQQVSTKLFYTTSFNKRRYKKTISHRGASLWANVEQQFKDKSHNAFSKQC